MADFFFLGGEGGGRAVCDNFPGRKTPEVEIFRRTASSSVLPIMRDETIIIIFQTLFKWDLFIFRRKL